ncbi:MAG TPA: hypothetical protein VF510_24755 [Ktedonobacterales bacterium]
MSASFQAPGPSPAAIKAGGMFVPSATDVVIPLPYLITGIGAAALFGVLLPWIASDALLSPEMPHVLALVHVATLGWLTMLVLGASLQLTPVMTVGPLRGARFVRWQFPVYVAGVGLLVSGFWFFSVPLIIFGGTLVVVAVFHHVVILERTILLAQTRTLSMWFMGAAFLHLLVVVGLGLTMALNFQLDFLGIAWQRVLLMHLTLGIAGWLTNMLVGVSYTLVRMFALVHDYDDRIGRVSFVMVQCGIIGMALGGVVAWSWLQIAGGLVLCGGIWLFGYDGTRMLRLRRRRPLDVTLRHSIAAVVYLGVCAPLGLLVLLLGDHAVRHLAALVLALLVGWLGQSTVGYLYKIVPFLVWQSRFSPLLGRQKVPLMRDMIHQRWAEASWWTINLGLPVAVVALSGGWVWPLRAGAAVLGAGLLLAARNILGAALQRPQSG